MDNFISSLNFSKLISHVFPGFLFVFSLFILIDSFCTDPGMYTCEMFEGNNLEKFIVIIGVFLMLGTIIGIIIDGIQHITITKWFGIINNRSNSSKKIGNIYKILNSTLLKLFSEKFLFSSEDKEKIMNELDKKYLFSWDEIPGKDNARFIEFMSEKFKVKWIKIENIKKNNETKIIEIFGENKYVSLSLDNNDKKAILNINNKKQYELNVEKENDNLNIYDNIDLLNWLFYFPIVDSEKYIIYQNDIYYYYEFFSNIFLVLLFTSLSMFFYSTRVLNLSFGIYLSILIFLISLLCLYIAWYLHKQNHKILLNLILGTLVEKVINANKMN